jgi:hypothetical protein
MSKFDMSNYGAGDNFGAGNNFDDGISNALSQITLKVVNGIAATQKIEFFNYLRSIVKIVNANITASLPFAYADIAITVAGAAGTPNLVSRVYFTDAGSLVIESAAGTLCTLSCTTVPYRTLFEGSASLPFKVEKLRFSFTTDPQLDEEITVFRNTIFGSYSEKKISPRTFLDPNQQQSKVVDIPMSFQVNCETGINLNILSGETVSLALFVSTTTNPAV